MLAHDAAAMRLRLLTVAVIGTGGAVLAAVSVAVPAELDLIRIVFWITVTLFSSALPVKLPGGVTASTTTTPLIAAVFDSGLANPFAVCWIALFGTIELRDVRRETAYWPLGTIYNRFGYVLAVFAAWSVARGVGSPGATAEPVQVVLQLLGAGLAFSGVNYSLAVLAASIRTGQPVARVWAQSISNVLPPLIAQVPLGWLMAEVAVKVGLWAALMVIIPLQLARYSLSKYTEIRDLFFGTVSALSQAIDAKDGFTRGHADRVSRIAGAIAREIGLPERQIEQIELAAMLHDIGKIGVEDRILMKPSRLDPEETQAMRRHSVYGASILEPSASLRPLVPMVLHHHESYDGSGYPDGLKGDDIPLGSRVIIVADAYEAMTSDRIYRKSIGHERAMEQLQKFKGIQFDARMVRAIDQILQKRGPAAFEVSDLPPIEYETLAALRVRLAKPPTGHDAHVG